MRPRRRAVPSPDSIRRAAPLAALILALGAALLAGAARAEKIDAAGTADQAADQTAGQPAPATRLKELESELKQSQTEHERAAERAAEAAREAEALSADLVSTAAAAQEHEEALSDLERRLEGLDAEQKSVLAALDLKRQQMNGVLTALTRLAFRPSEALIGQPTSPADTVRSAILLRDVVPRISHAADQLRAELDALARLRGAIGEQKAAFAQTAAKLAADHHRLATLYDKKAAMREQAEAQRRDTEARLAALATEAADLRDLLARIEQDRAAPGAKAPESEARPAAVSPAPAPPPASRPFSRAQGQMPMPARGAIVVHYGEKGEGGLPARGITVETRTGAQVVAPYDGQVVFAGPFRGYGLLLIIEHGEGYHTLLAGMARIDSAVGQRLVVGEPVGVMGDSEDKPLLYVELRHLGQPINPLPWLTARKSKVSG